MDFIPGLLGGFALFIYGMDQMGKGLELLAGNKLQDVLEKLTSNRFLGVLVGALVTAIIQSSSATTVMTVGFVNSRLISLKQAIYIIMGANIGTTVTGLLLTLDIDIIAPFLAFAGMIMMLFIKKRKYKYAGTIIFGFGVLFMGMNMMGDSVRPLAENESFVSLLAISKNPFVGIIVGTLFTAIIQSSSATTGILITFANNGIITFDSAFYLVLGTNIGTCVTSLLAGLNANKNAKRVAISHISFNIIGTIVFTILSLIFPIADIFKNMTPHVASQIAYLHTTFNIVTTFMLLPFTNILAEISKKVITGSDKHEEGMTLMYLDKVNYHDTIPTLAAIRQEIMRMFEYTKENLELAVRDVLDHDEDLTAEIDFNEEVIDFLNKEITSISVKTLTDNLNKTQYKQLSYYIRICSNIERLGDYSHNIMKLANKIHIENQKFTREAIEEIYEVSGELSQMYDIVMQSLRNNNFDMKNIRMAAFKIQDYAERNRQNSIERIREGKATAESGLIYDKLYTYLLRLKDHLLNISNQYATIYK